MPQADLTLDVRSISTAGAKLALAAAEQKAETLRLPMSIAIVDVAGNLVCFQRASAAPFTSVEAAIRKARTAAALSASTKVFEDLVHGGLTSMLSFEFISPSQGGLPLTVGAATIGAIGCSGSTGADDQAVAQAGVSALVDALNARPD